MNRWEQGRADVDLLIRQGRLTRVVPNRLLAQSYLTQSALHVSGAEAVIEIDAAGAFQLTYDSARKALAAILVNQGLRARGEGAHAVLLDVVIAQLEPPRQAEFRAFDWMRRLRNQTEYPDVDSLLATRDDVTEAIVSARAMTARAAQIVEVMPPY